ncbi:hypothetical protein AQUCO_00100476v1 [Aquilegia coerulea]|uniref:Uncharacterized protein n=1 Tax=Aquilegia coerulea TaxID=218851 RepID=A0A2G5FAI2_AQUCA|nr:hypothetical protein AQUCO_00100476v1 [Aquilegia coerulea]
MHKYSVVLDDFGLEPMLEKLMDDFIRPMSRVFFPEVGGAILDSHHGFVVEYGRDKDVGLGNFLVGTFVSPLFIICLFCVFSELMYSCCPFKHNCMMIMKCRLV